MIRLTLILFSYKLSPKYKYEDNYKLFVKTLWDNEEQYSKFLDEIEHTYVTKDNCTTLKIYSIQGSNQKHMYCTMFSVLIKVLIHRNNICITLLYT